VPEDLLDPRASIVGGDYDTPADISAREDIIAGMKMIFGDLYYNDTLSVGFADLENSTLADLSRQHASCYHEAQGLRTECIARGIEFDDEKIRKAMSYHLRMAETMNGIITRRLEDKKNEG